MSETGQVMIRLVRQELDEDIRRLLLGTEEVAQSGGRNALRIRKMPAPVVVFSP